jgi:hypothetical protein
MIENTIKWLYAQTSFVSCYNIVGMFENTCQGNHMWLDILDTTDRNTFVGSEVKEAWVYFFQTSVGNTSNTKQLDLAPRSLKMVNP